MNAENNTLADYLDYDLSLLSIGLNPSIMSVQSGLYFANPRNRFWRAFIQSGFIEECIDLNKSIHNKLLHQYSIGFTDVVKKPSSSSKVLTAIDFKRDAPKLRANCEIYSPNYLWFHGKVALTQFSRYAYGYKQEWQWGINQCSQIPFNIFLSPNPSSANAVFSLPVITDYYAQLHLFIEMSRHES